MRTAIQCLAILTIAALVAPSVRWASLRSPGEACACPPDACMCVTRQHASGHMRSCCMGKGGHCGLESHDAYVNSVLGSLIYVPTEHPWSNPLTSRNFADGTLDLSVLPSHARIPEQPPRIAL